jgi:ABC-type nitrate/sulfonate/bicarbonate transport system ATPase subunit
VTLSLEAPTRTSIPTVQPDGRSLQLDRITHRYGAQTAVDDVTLSIAGGELVSLLGPSGCGKTTLLWIVAGFVVQNLGRVVIGGMAVDHLPPARREVGIVFQNYALFPHMTVAENVAYGLAARGADRSTQKAEAARMLELVRLGHLARRLPRALSGGQQQRVALARALAVKPSILLLDELFSALDKNLRRGGKSRCAGITVPAGSDRHLTRQLQCDPNSEGAGRAGGVGGAEGRRHRLQDDHAYQQELVKHGTGVQADRGGTVARGADRPDAIALSGDAHQREGGDQRSGGPGPCPEHGCHETAFRLPGLVKVNEQRAAWIDQFNHEMRS